MTKKHRKPSQKLKTINFQKERQRFMKHPSFSFADGYQAGVEWSNALFPVILASLAKTGTKALTAKNISCKL